MTKAHYGQRILQTVAQRNVRAFDAVGRWGGEEFAIVAQNVGAGMLRGLAERLRILIEQCALSVDTASVRVTVSLGAVIARSDDTPLSLFERADHVLYQSKRRRRNCVLVEETLSLAGAAGEAHAALRMRTESPSF
ncbi:MAG: GGDEF domain-containing protein [Roseiflexus sp.]|nr:GGDEF domain-containing protein [Roseiflexus sp.]MCS7291316.1 GGDEF domain-containing protein [Roseiflexus sp.]MDW8146639.1 GGDEF domain-containing protein [Roseiflexaceae bacterium]MDW8232899.1 GGDEF domain-containing protein [Roseiflexaceae bacterium]